MGSKNLKSLLILHIVDYIFNLGRFLYFFTKGSGFNFKFYIFSH